MGTMKSIALTLAFVLLGAAGCEAFDDEPDQSDGEVCSSDDECSTGVCTTASLCSHHACNCPSGSCAPAGEETDACRDGWVCVGYESIFAPVVDFFGGEPNEKDGYCVPRCEGGCPEHYLCNGDLCSPDTLWPYPTPIISWSGVVSGELHGGDAVTTRVTVEEGSTLTLRGSAQSPDGTMITGLTWTTVSQAGDSMTIEGESLEITVPVGAGSYRRAELTAIDARGRAGIIDVVFDACFGAGTTCGYEGSGCCTSCDDASSTCQ
jgi:hypothetical protein